MARTIEVDSVDHTALIRHDSLVAVEMAFGGEVGQGGFQRDDTALGDVPAMKLVTIVESAASPTRMFTGYTSVRGLRRGPFKVSTDRQWDVTILDLNTILDDEVLQVATANRPAETDYERVTWLLTAPALIEALGVTAGVVPNTNTVNMDATNYRHSGIRRVLEDCAAASNKNYFLYNYGSGNKLYYDLATGTSLDAAVTLSSVLADVDNSTCFAVMNPSLDMDATGIYSSVDFKYDGGFIYVKDTGVASAYRAREIALEDSTVTSSTTATNRANKFIDAAGVERQTFKCSVMLPAANVNDIRAGQRIQVKVPHLGVSAFTYYRITRREVILQESEQYLLNLEFADNVLPANQPGSGGGGSTSGGFGGDTWVSFIDETGDTLSPWTEALGSWSIVSSNIHVAADAGSNSALFWSTVEPTASVIIEAEMRRTGVTGGDFGVLAAAYFYLPDPTDSPVGYIVAFSSTGNSPGINTDITGGPGGGGVTIISDNGISAAQDTWYKLRVLRTGMFISVWVDGELFSTGVFGEQYGGGTELNVGLAVPFVGLWVRTTAADFRNIKAWRLAMPA